MSYLYMTNVINFLVKSHAEIPFFRSKNKTKGDAYPMKEKLSYTEAELEVVRLEYQDIVTASGDQWYGNDNNVDPDGWV